PPADRQRPLRRRRVLAADEEADILDQHVAVHLVPELALPAVWITYHDRAAIVRIPGLDRYREDEGNPWIHGLPGQAPDQHEVVRDIPLPQVLRGHDDDLRGGVVGADRAVDLDQGVQVGQPREPDVVQVSGVGAGWAPVIRQAGADQR